MAVATEDEVLSESDREAIERVNQMPELDGKPKSVEEIAAEEAEEGEQISLLDFGDTVSLKLAGKKPSESTIKIKAVQKDIKGQLGDTSDDEAVFVLVRAVLDTASVKNFRDDNRKVRSKKRVHLLEPIGVVRVPDDVAETLFDQYR